MLAGLLFSNFAFAYTLNVPFGTDRPPFQPGYVEGPASYIRTLYNFGLGFGALLAILMIVIGGVQYTVSEAVGNKQDALDRIKSAIWGLALLLAAFIILNTINPQLQELKEPVLTPLPPQSQTALPSCLPGGACSPDNSLCEDREPICKNGKCEYQIHTRICKNGKWD